MKIIKYFYKILKNILYRARFFLPTYIINFVLFLIHVRKIKFESD